jgi:Flp pilus assembly protein TadB
MATQKQRRRRAKEKRHAYDLVEIDAEGKETVLTASELKSESKTEEKSESRRQTGKLGRGTAQPPSWQRVFKRGALFAPIFLVTVMLLAGDRLSFVGAVVQTLFLLAIFVPFSYFMDRLVWRAHEKRRLKDAGR